jgi:hypothetical protein
LTYTTIIKNPDYDKNQETIEKDVEKGKYQTDITYREAMYEVTRIGQDMYKKMQLVPNIIQVRNEMGKLVAKYNYVNLLLGTVDGVRVSLYEMMYELSVIYNIIRFMINRELAKLKGKVFYYDEAYLPKGKTLNDILYRMTEDSIVTFNSKQSGNDDDDPKAKDIRTQIGDMDLGVSQGLGLLITAGQDIERTLDRITGITDARQGVSKASATATAITTSTEASRACTQDIFYFFEEYINEVLTTVVERYKAKIASNPSDEHEMIVGANGIKFFSDNKKLTLDDYAAFIGNGRQELQIREKMKRWIELQINAGELRAHDAGKAELEETMNGFLKVLEDGWKAIQDANVQQSEAKANENLQTLRQQIELQDQNREDLQQHEKDLINLEYDRKAGLQQGVDIAKSEMNEAKIQADLLKAGQAVQADNSESNNFPI